ncbi:hypothetical protein Tco_0958873 [Tanacetum coccineum]
MTKITDVEASLKQFKSASLTYQEETSKRFNQMQKSINKNKADTDKQFTEFSDEVEKEGKDIGFIGAIVTDSEVVDGYGGKTCGENLP